MLVFTCKTSDSADSIDTDKKKPENWTVNIYNNAKADIFGDGTSLQVEIKDTPREESESPDKQSPPVDSKDNSEEKPSQGKRGGLGLRIPIFFKLAILSTLLLVLVISIISFSMLEKQKKQFIDQLIVLGESMLHVVAENAPDKLLGEEDLALFKLVKDISQNEQVVYALITDKKGNIKITGKTTNV